MKFCCTLGTIHPDALVELAVTADENGWDCVQLADHVATPSNIQAKYPYSADGKMVADHETPWPDVWVATAMMAANTKNLRFTQGMYVLPMRDPFSVAKATGTLARMSGNRFNLGVGMGWMSDEFELLGRPFAHRGSRADEMIEVMKKLWTGELVEHHGKFYDFEPLSMVPGIDTDIPIIIGGMSDAALRRVARIGDGWAPFMKFDDTLAAMEKIRRMRREKYDRENAPLDVYAACPDCQDLDGFKRMEEAGISHLVTKPWCMYTNNINAQGVAPLAEMKDGIKRFTDEVISQFR